MNGPNNTELYNSVAAAGNRAAYDAQAKRLIGNKSILGYILADAVPPYQGMDPKDASNCIENEPMIGCVPVDPGLTNSVKENEHTKGERIIGLNTESKEIGEGANYYDVLFYANTGDGSAQIIINVEEQQDRPSDYQIMNRAQYYACRLISSQQEREFKGSNYDNIKSIYSIWICMYERENSLTRYRLTAEQVLGTRVWPGNLEMINIIMIGIGNILPAPGGRYRLHRLLGTLLSKSMVQQERLQIMENEFDLPMRITIKEGVNDMCNLSQGIVDDTVDAMNKKHIMNMYRRGDTIEEMMAVTELSAEEVQAYIDQALAEESESV